MPAANGQLPKGLIVALHGWGANAEDLPALLPFFNLPDYQFVFPNAPFPYPYSSNGRAWYDLQSENSYRGLTESRELLTDFMQSLISSTGVPLSRTILCGFSQGAAMTLDVGLNLPLAGLVVLSGYLHPILDAAKSTFPPVLIAHGRQDTVVPLVAAQKARDALQSLGVAVTYQEFDMGHEIRPETIALMRDFIVRVMQRELQNFSR